MVRVIFSTVMLVTMVALYSRTTVGKNIENASTEAEYDVTSPECNGLNEELVEAESFTCDKSCYDLEGLLCNNEDPSSNESQCRCKPGYIRGCIDNACILPETCAEECEDLMDRKIVGNKFNSDPSIKQ